MRAVRGRGGGGRDRAASESRECVSVCEGESPGHFLDFQSIPGFLLREAYPPSVDWPSRPSRRFPAKRLSASLLSVPLQACESRRQSRHTAASPPPPPQRTPAAAAAASVRPLEAGRTSRPSSRGRSRATPAWRTRVGAPAGAEAFRACSSPALGGRWDRARPLSKRFIPLAIKVFGSSAVDPGSIPGSSQLRQKGGVEQEIANFCCLKFMIFCKT